MPTADAPVDENRIASAPVIAVCDSQVEPKRMLFLSRLCSWRRERVCVEQVLAAPACYFAVLAAGKKLMRRLLILLVSWEKEKGHSFVVPSYGRQFRSRIGQQRPLLLSYKVSRSYRIIWPRALAYCKNFIVTAERCRVPALSSLYLVVPLGRSVRFALQAIRVGVIAMEIKIQIAPAKHK